MQLYSADATIFFKNINFFPHENIKKTELMAVWIFFSLQPWLPKTAQNLKFILEMWLKIPLSTTLWFEDMTNVISTFWKKPTF